MFFFSVVGPLFLIIYVQEMYFYLLGYLAFSLLNDRNRTNCIILAPKFCLHAKSRPVKVQFCTNLTNFICHVTIKDKPELQISWSRHHRTVSYNHHKEDKPLGREINKAKQSGLHTAHSCDNEIHILCSKISRKSHTDTVTMTTLELFFHNLHILPENRGKSRRNHRKNSERKLQRPWRKTSQISVCKQTVGFPVR